MSAASLPFTSISKLSRGPLGCIKKLCTSARKSVTKGPRSSPALAWSAVVSASALTVLVQCSTGDELRKLLDTECHGPSQLFQCRRANDLIPESCPTPSSNSSASRRQARCSSTALARVRTRLRRSRVDDVKRVGSSDGSRLFIALVALPACISPAAREGS